MTDRLRELAQIGSDVEHDFDRIKNGKKSKHGALISACQHPDCVLVRAEVSSPARLQLPSKEAAEYPNKADRAAIEAAVLTVPSTDSVSDSKEAAPRKDADPSAIERGIPDLPSSPNPPCEGCGGPHPFDTVVVSPRWNAVIRANDLPDYLCATCILAAFVRHGESFTAEIDGRPFEVVVNGVVAKSAIELSQQNTDLRVVIRQAINVLEEGHTLACRPLAEGAASSAPPALEQNKSEKI